MSSIQSAKTELKVQVRDIVRRDLAEVLEIERACFEQSWIEEDFLVCLRQRNGVGKVFEHDRKIVGFMIYELHKTMLNIRNFAVSPLVQRHRVGSQMIRNLVNKLTALPTHRNEIRLEVRETNLQAQLFLSNQGFRAFCLLQGHYNDTKEDAYAMRYELHATNDWVLPFSPRNRISEYDAP